MPPLAVRVHADRPLSGGIQPPSPSISDLTGTVGRPCGSMAGGRSVKSCRNFCSTESWGTASGPGDALTRTVAAGAVARPGTFAPTTPQIRDPGAVVWAGA